MSNEINIDSLIKRADDFIASELDDGLVMMGLENNAYYGLDEIGKKVWELLENEITVKDIISNMMEEYNVDAAQCTQDILDLLNHLRTEGMLEVA